MGSSLWHFSGWGETVVEPAYKKEIYKNTASEDKSGVIGLKIQSYKELQKETKYWILHLRDF